MLANLFNRLTPKRKWLSAPLVGVNGFTGRGDASFSLHFTGNASFGVNLRGVSGRKAEIFVNDRQIGSIKIHEGRASMRFQAKDKSNPSIPEDGAQIEIRQNGDAILKGVFTPTSGS